MTPAKVDYDDNIGAKGKVKGKPRSETILIKLIEGISFPEVFPEVHTNVRQENDGVDVKSLLRTRTGDILKLGLKTDEKSSFCEIAQSMEPVVYSLEPMSILKIKDLDCLTNTEEVAETIKRTTQM